MSPAESPRFRLPERTAPQIGVCYYHEYMPYPRLERDLDLMVDAGISLIRIGESVWAKWEPRDGEFDASWCDEIVAAARERSIDVVLGMPTYAIPPWMARTHPEVMAHRGTGSPVPYGRRQNVDYSHPAFRFYAQRIVERIARHYEGEPAIVGYQIDNEPGVEVLHNPGVFAGFVDYLRDRFGSVEELNRAWGLVYWSQSLSDWSDLWIPDGNVNPGYNLAWREYQTLVTAEYIAWQADLVRPYIRDDQFLMTCLALGARPGNDPARTGRSMDVIAANSYYQMGKALTHPSITLRPDENGLREDVGPWFPTFEADYARGIARGPWLLTEATSGPLAFPHGNYPAYDGQWRQAAWLFVSRGARLIQYWQWATPHYGVEGYWGGILGHHLEPGRCLAEIATIAQDFARAGDRVVDVRPTADIAILMSQRSRWAMELQPPFTVEMTSTPDVEAYDRVLLGVAKACFDARRSVDIVLEEDFAESAEEYAATTPVLVVPMLYAVDDAMLGALLAYARAGGHLLLTFRTGYADEHGTIRHEVMPGALREAVGASYLEFANVGEPVPLRSLAEDSPRLPANARATKWADYLVAEGATPLVGYAGELGAWAAMTTHRYGDGRVSYLGTIPDPETLQAIVRWAVPEPASALWGELPASVTVSAADSRDGERLWFVWNWSGTPVSVTSPITVVDAVEGTRFVAGGTIPLEPWGTIVLVEVPQGAAT